MIKIILYLLLVATIHALWEIQIEGKNGWARRLPTFRINVFFRKLLGGKSLTGYHFFMMLFFIVIFHGVYLFQSWEVKSEYMTLGLFCWYFIIEDFLWFVFNKHYGIKKFKRGNIKWHKRWVGILPFSYCLFGGIGIVLFILSYL